MLRMRAAASKARSACIGGRRPAMATICDPNSHYTLIQIHCLDARLPRQYVPATESFQGADMLIPLPIIRLELGPGGTAALDTPCGTGIRVVKGKVWATTTGSLDDVWLHAGEEHRVPKPGLTVIEA